MFWKSLSLHAACWTLKLTTILLLQVPLASSCVPMYQLPQIFSVERSMSASSLLCYSL